MCWVCICESIYTHAHTYMYMCDCMCVCVNEQLQILSKKWDINKLCKNTYITNFSL